MDSAAGNAGITLAAASSSQSSYVDFAYPNVLGKGKIQYNHSNNSMAIFINGTQKLTLDTGYLGVGTATPTSSLHVAGNVGATLTTGVHAGRNPSSTSNAILAIVAAGTTAKAQLGFSSTGYAFYKHGMIQVDPNNKTMGFYNSATVVSGVPVMFINSSTVSKQI